MIRSMTTSTWPWKTRPWACSAFGVIGKIHEGANGKRVMDVQYTYDERVEDGLYAAASMGLIKDKLEDPEALR